MKPAARRDALEGHDVQVEPAAVVDDDQRRALGNVFDPDNLESMVVFEIGAEERPPSQVVFRKVTLILRDLFQVFGQPRLVVHF